MFQIDRRFIKRIYLSIPAEIFTTRDGQRKANINLAIEELPIFVTINLNRHFSNPLSRVDERLG